MFRVSEKATFIAWIHLVALGAPAIADAQEAPPTTPAPAQAASACAGGADIVERVDGRKVVGEVIDAIAGGNVRIQLGDGTMAAIPWQEVAKIERCPAPSTGATTPSGTPVAAAPPPGLGERTSFVRLHLEGTEIAQVEQDTTGFHRKWEPVCNAPCDKALPLGYSYRIVGDGLRTSMPFKLGAPPGKNETLVVSEGSSGRFALGIVGIAVGGLGIPGGLLIAFEGQFSRSQDDSENRSLLGRDDAIAAAGWTLAAVSVAVLVGSIVLTVSNAHTHVVDRTRAAAPPPPYPLRVSAFSDGRRETAPLPRTVGVPLLSGQF